MVRNLLLGIFFSLMLGACSINNYQNLDESPLAVGVRDSLFNLEMLYVGATPDYLIFETSFQNKSEDTLLLQREDFTINFLDEYVEHKPYPTQQVLSILSQRECQLVKRRKRTTFWNGVGFGASIIVSVLTGAPPIDNVFIGLDNMAFIFDERNYQKQTIEALREEMIHIEKYNLEAVRVAPNQTAQHDVLFPYTRTKGDTEVIYAHPSGDYIMTLTARELQFSRW